MTTKKPNAYLVRVDGSCPEHDPHQIYRIQGDHLLINEGDLLILETDDDKESAEIKAAFSAGTWDSVIPESASNFKHTSAAQ